ncbi:glycine zipper family protein [Pseudomonas sp. MAFF212428]|uniref:Glycine zipper family protein n=1 Tax=Pseudomonas brassicae TaxID=2708063 RepID=A0A6M0CUE5_9PSED|nr:glycine zipper family protein [Pseudomonas brassicae]
MKSSIWPLAGVGLLCLSLNVQAQGDRHGPQPDPNGGDRPPAASPLNARPDEVRQTQPARQGYYQDVPRRNDGNPHWQAGGPGPRPGDGHHGSGWGPGPQYRPGHTIDRFADQYRRVPYRGHDYYYSGGYWYQPQGPRYVVVAPPYGARVNDLPDYAQQVWVGSTLFFLAAGTYYQYQDDRREYVVVNPPVQQRGGYDVIAYPAYGQTPPQAEQDRYQCHRWAVEQTGFDPAAASYTPPAQVADNYRRALGACLSGRGYSVN